MVDIARLRAVANDARLRSDTARASSRAAMGRVLEARKKFARSRARAEARLEAEERGEQVRDDDGSPEGSAQQARRPRSAR